MKFLVIKHEPACIGRGFEFLRDDYQLKMVKTIEGQQERKFKLIEVTEFDPVHNEYAEIGQHWVDVMTGSLYKPTTGECLTSTQIQLIV